MHVFLCVKPIAINFPSQAQNLYLVPYTERKRRQAEKEHERNQATTTFDCLFVFAGFMKFKFYYGQDENLNRVAE